MLAFLFLVSLASAVSVSPCNKDTIYAALKQEIIPHRDNVTASLIDAYIVQKNGRCLFMPLPFNGQSIVSLCDSNGDGVISLSDWNNSTGCSNKIRPYFSAICNFLDCQ